MCKLRGIAQSPSKVEKAQQKQKKPWKATIDMYTLRKGKTEHQATINFLPLCSNPNTSKPKT